MPGGARLVTCSHGHHAAAHNLGARHHAAAHRLHGEGRGEKKQPSFTVAMLCR